MRKFLNFAMLAVMLLAFSSCNDSDKPSNAYTYQVLAYNHFVKDGRPTMRRTTTSFTISYAENTIDIALYAYPADGNEITVQTGVMELVWAGTTTYSFAHASLQAGDHTISNLHGYLDVATNSLYIAYRIDGGSVCYSTSRPLFAYCSTVVTDLSDTPKQPLQLDNTMYGFVTNDLSGKAMFAILNFQINAVESPVGELDFNNIELTVTNEGYTLAASSAQPTASVAGDAKYPISDLAVSINLEACTITGSYNCDQKKVTFSGKMFDLALYYAKNQSYNFLN